jgi:beta-glucosidase-like glycosyl hydrolase/CubicO group peptidase (beta-lactamase class C family)
VTGTISETSLLKNQPSFHSSTFFLFRRNIVFLFSGVFFLLAGFQGKAQPRKEAWIWADSVYKTLTPKERLGQLFMVAAYSNKGIEHQAEIEKLIREYGLGGLIYFQGGPGRQARQTNYYQSFSKVPLLIGMDAEWGLGMRLDSTLNFPRQMTLGALSDVSLIQKMGEVIGQHCKRLGVHVSFSPVVDINSNPANPVIGYRAFSEDKESVAVRGSAYMKGLQSQGVLAVAKHFPGHGDADADSHYALPTINRTLNQIKETELYPFRRLIADSVAGVMVAHLSVPVLDATPNVATTLSKKVVTDLLRKDLGFEGLIFTDALNMKGVSKYFQPGETDVKALLAGNDILLFPEDMPKGVQMIETAIAKKQIRWKELDKRIKKILAWKYEAGLNKKPVINLENLAQDLDNSEDRIFIKSLYAGAITVVKNKKSILPFRNVDSTSFSSVLIGQDNPKNPFQKALSNYAAFDHHQIPDKASDAVFDEVLKKVKGKTVVVAFGKLNNTQSKNFGITPQMEAFVKALSQKADVVTVHFGNAYSTGKMETYPGVVCAYEWNDYTQALVPEVLFGAITATGRMPVSTGLTIKYGMGYATPELDRLRFAEPEEVGMNSSMLARIDSFANRIIADHATPGCQILVAKDGAVVYQKSFGYQTYDSLSAVNDETLYDIASITKVAATLQGVMFLQERGQINVYERASEYLPELKGTNKENILISEILVHQAGLQPFIPYWKRTLRTADLAETFYCDEKDNNWFCTEVVPGLYSMRTMEDTLWKWVIQSDMLPRNRQGGNDYKYSDLGFYILKRLVETVLNEPIENFLQRRYYQPLGLERLCFLPKRYFPEMEIAPTEKDTLFRQSLVRGNVHDPGAAMFGGIAGHAGLFANSYSLAVLMQMNMNFGYYGGRYLHLPQTVRYFAQRQFPRNRRGFGWDKPYLWSKDGPTSSLCSPETFGHTGFTGTCVWADPKYNLIFVFLSNRVFPDAENSKLIKNNIRPRIHDMVYQAMVQLPKESAPPAEEVKE